MYFDEAFGDLCEMSEFDVSVFLDGVAALATSDGNNGASQSVAVTAAAGGDVAAATTDDRAYLSEDLAGSDDDDGARAAPHGIVMSLSDTSSDDEDAPMCQPAIVGTTVAKEKNIFPSPSNLEGEGKKKCPKPIARKQPRVPPPTPQKTPQHRRRRTGGVRTRRRTKPGAAAEREIKHLQRSCETLIPQAPFQLLVREICEDVCGNSYRFEQAAFAALQVAAEDFIVASFSNSGLLAAHADRATVCVEDSRLALKLTAPDVEGELDDARRRMERRRKRVMWQQELLDRELNS